jgi:hypothetical protein
MPRHFDFTLTLFQSGVNQMTFKRLYGAGLAALAVGLFAATAAYAEPTVNKGDNAWMLTSTVLVLLMTIPGLALFYGGLVRSKNMLSVLAQIFYTVCVSPSCGRCTATASPSPADPTSSAASRRPS